MGVKSLATSKNIETTVCFCWSCYCWQEGQAKAYDRDIWLTMLTKVKQILDEEGQRYKKSKIHICAYSFMGCFLNRSNTFMGFYFSFFIYGNIRLSASNPQQPTSTHSHISATSAFPTNPFLTHKPPHLTHINPHILIIFIFIFCFNHF